MNGIDDSFYTTPDMEEGAVKRAIMEKHKEQKLMSIRLVKLDQVSFVKSGSSC